MADKRKLFCNIYGDPKSGKSTLSGTAPGPKYLLDVEGRAPESDGDERVRIFGHDDMAKALRTLQREPHEFKSIVWDSTTALGDNLIMDITDGKKPDWESWGMLKRYATRYGQQLRDIMDRTDIEVVYLITGNRVWKNPDDKEDIRNILDLDGAFREKIRYMVDMTGYMHNNVRRSGQVSRKLIVGPTRGYPHVGHAFGDKLPTDIEDPTIPKILDLIYS